MQRRPFAAAALALALSATAAAARQQQPQQRDSVANTSYRAPDGSRVLQQRVVVPAGVRDVWQAFTTSEGVRSWAVPVAQVDFRVGGIWESSYDPERRIGDPGNIRNRFLSYIPMRMLSMQVAAAPPGFPSPELLPAIATVIELDSLTPGSTGVTMSMVGYRDGEGYDRIYALFERGNAWSLGKLRERFTTGPVDWKR